MKHSVLHLSLSLTVIAGVVLSTSQRARAQAVQTAVEDAAVKGIVGEIERNSGGSITIDIPENLLRLVEPVIKPEVKESPEPQRKHRHTTAATGPRQMSGYRIQIFSDGRNQSTLKSRARARANSVLARFPKYRNQVYSFSKVPNWYTRVGNFKTQQEANAALAELRRAFPGFAGEMRVVRSSIVVVD